MLKSEIIVLKSIALLLLTLTIISCGSSPARKQNNVTPGNQPVSTKGDYGVYGNWCGPDHPVDALMDKAPGPVDRLDAACMIHDYCYKERGYLDCDCDEGLTSTLKTELAANTMDSKQALVARGIHNYFAASPCKDYSGKSEGKTAANRGMYRLYEGTKKRVISIYNKVTGKDSGQESSAASN